MKKFNIYPNKFNLILIIAIFYGCGKDNSSLENRIDSHKNKVYLIGDSIKIIDQRIDSLIQIYSPK